MKKFVLKRKVVRIETSSETDVFSEGCKPVERKLLEKNKSALASEATRSNIIDWLFKTLITYLLISGLLCGVAACHLDINENITQNWNRELPTVIIYLISMVVGPCFRLENEKNK